MVLSTRRSGSSISSCRDGSSLNASPQRAYTPPVAVSTHLPSRRTQSQSNLSSNPEQAGTLSMGEERALSAALETLAQPLRVSTVPRTIIARKYVSHTMRFQQRSSANPSSALPFRNDTPPDDVTLSHAPCVVTTLFPSTVNINVPPACTPQ